MEITGLKQSEKNRSRWYVVLDDGEYIQVNVNIIADYGIFPGRQLDNDEYEELKCASRIASARERALRITAVTAVSKAELIRRLIAKGEDSDAAEKAADQMEAIGAVNDREYADMVVRHGVSKGWGRRRIQDELFQKRIPRELWEDALRQVPEPDEAVDKFLNSKLDGEWPDDRELKRVTDALRRRGYSWDDIQSGLARYRENTEEN